MIDLSKLSPRQQAYLNTVKALGIQAFSLICGLLVSTLSIDNGKINLQQCLVGCLIIAIATIGHGLDAFMLKSGNPEEVALAPLVGKAADLGVQELESGGMGEAPWKNNTALQAAIQAQSTAPTGVIPSANRASTPPPAYNPAAASTTTQQYAGSYIFPSTTTGNPQ